MADTTQKLGQYTLLEKIAQGGMAQVYKAKTIDASGIERLVVIKRILPHISADPEYVEMLIDEAKIAVHFNHGNIAQVYDLGRVAEDYFIVMEYVDGRTLSQIYKRLAHLKRPIPIDILLYCIIELCHGLSYIHHKKGADGKNLGVVHRDVSPQNIILTYGGNIKIIDFGVAKARIKEGKTESGVLKGKFAYMSPEQSRSDRIDHRSDIFSVGILLWEIATGERLFKRKTNHETVQAIQKNKVQSPSELRGTLPREFDKIVKKALQKVAKQRYQDALELATDLERLLITVNPEFKPVNAAEFLYKLFGPEEDEADLPNPIFAKEKTPVTRIVARAYDDDKTEESTHKEKREEKTPVVRFRPSVLGKNNFYLITVLSVVLFLCAGVYVFIVNHMGKATLILNGLDSSMTVTLDDEPQNLDDNELKIKSGVEHHLVISKLGYDSFEKDITLDSMEKSEIAFSLVKTAPKTGSLLVSSDPPGATIYLDNVQWRDVTPAIIPKLIAGKNYKVGLFHEGYQFFSQNIAIEGGSNSKITKQLLKNFATVVITTNIKGAKIIIDDVLVGETPLTLPQITPNEEHSLKLILTGFKTEETKFIVTPGEEKGFTFNLEKE